MYRYELTERGKIVIAVLIVLLLLALSAILMIKALANQTSTQTTTQDATAYGLVPSTAPPPLSIDVSTPLPSGSLSVSPSEMSPETDINPSPSGGASTLPDVSSPTDSEDEDFGNQSSNSNDIEDNDGEENNTANNNGTDIDGIPPTIGLSGGHPTEGMLSFIFAPNYQDALDTETMSALSVLISSPSYSHSSTIAVETPALSDYYTQVLMTAINNAFAAYGIYGQSIAHIILQSVTVDESFEVSIYLIPENVK